ncbi:MAG TPA: PDZ domain-containing protein [Thermoanaerobaculia bacterium]|nr:PDZ domain-containing protein [Thermoanaerobaculia bacterium]
MQLSYVLSWQNANDHLFDIAITFTAPHDTPRLTLPAWRPGRYHIQNYAANVREWSAGERRIWKDGKSSWRVDARAGDEITVRYRYYAGVLDAGSSFLDESEAYFNGSNLFMMVDGLRGQQHHLTIAAPADWRIETQLAVCSEQSAEAHGNPLPTANCPLQTEFVARDYDHLIDSPTICAATMTRYSFVEADARIHLIWRGDDGIDTEQYVDPVRAIVRSQAKLFGGLPLSDYRFLVHAGERWHGVEHEDSCSILARRSALLGATKGDEGYNHMLAISAHELFHLWNVKRIVPAVFSPYDYSVETPTRLLWAMEGITSYYGELTLLRAGLWDEGDYLEHLCKEIETLESSPARQFLSLAQASFDGWIQEASHMHDRANAWFSFYNKGEVVSALLDLRIAQATNGEKSLDDVMRILWDEYGRTRRGLEEDAIERVVARVADVGDFFERYVDGTEPLPYNDLFDAAGIEIEIVSRSRDAMALGAKLKSDEGLLEIDNVIRGGAAMEAGLLPGDELLAIDGTRTLSEADVRRSLKSLREGESVEVMFARTGVVRSASLVGRRDPRVSVTLRVARDSELRKQWLRRDA